MVLSIEERIFLVEYVSRANGEYTEAVKQEFMHWDHRCTSLSDYTVYALWSFHTY